MFQRFTQSKDFVLFPAIFTLLILFGCGTDENIVTPDVTTTPGAYTSAEDVIALIKAHEDFMPLETQPSEILMAPESGEWEVGQMFNVRRQSQVTILDVPGVPKHVRFKVMKGALEKRTFITMKLRVTMTQNAAGEPDVSSLHFEFGPSGTQFSPSAILRIPFGLIMMRSVDIIAVTDENGDEVDGCSYDIDYKDEYVITYIPHFSRYHYDRR